MSYIRLILYVIVGLILVVGTMTVTSFLGDPFGIQERKTEQAISDAMKAKGEAATNNAQAGLGIDWAKIASDASTRDRGIERTRTSNAEQIRQAGSGDNTPISDALIAASTAGLCNYESTPCASSD